MGIFDKSNYIVNTGIIEQFFQCTTKMILLAKMIKLWTFYENVVLPPCLPLSFPSPFLFSAFPPIPIP